MKNYNELKSDFKNSFEELELDELQVTRRKTEFEGLENTTEFYSQISEETADSFHEGYNAEYRGWYGTKNRPRWCPQQSKFRGRGGAHQGVDLFVIKGTKLVALVDGKIQYNPQGGGGKWGNHIWLNFKYQNNNFTFVYAHLNSLIGSNNRKVKAGEVICESGCSGNTVYCGTLNKCGGKEDHVHLELFGPSGRMDPIAALGWNVKHSNDKRCLYPLC